MYAPIYGYHLAITLSFKSDPRDRLSVLVCHSGLRNYGIGINPDTHWSCRYFGSNKTVPYLRMTETSRGVDTRYSTSGSGVS